MPVVTLISVPFPLDCRPRLVRALTGATQGALALADEYRASITVHFELLDVAARPDGHAIPGGAAPDYLLRVSGPGVTVEHQAALERELIPALVRELELDPGTVVTVGVTVEADEEPRTASTDGGH